MRVRGPDAEVHIPLRSKLKAPEFIARGDVAVVTVPPLPPPPHKGIMSCITPLYRICNRVKSAEVRPFVVIYITSHTCC